MGQIEAVYSEFVYQRSLLPEIASGDVWCPSVLMKVCVEFPLWIFAFDEGNVHQLTHQFDKIVCKADTFWDPVG